MKFSTFAERLLLYKANRSIARGERARIKQQELEREFAGYQRANKELMMWAERYPDHPYLYVISQEIEKIDLDLRYTELTRGRKMGLAAVNGLRNLRGRLPQEEVKKYDVETFRKNLIGKGVTFSILVVLFFTFCHSPKTSSPTTTSSLVTTEPSATPSPTPSPTPSTTTDWSVASATPSVIETPAPSFTPTPTPRPFKHRHRKIQ
jgi:hypothetical protein